MERQDWYGGAKAFFLATVLVFALMAMIGWMIGAASSSAGGSEPDPTTSTTLTPPETAVCNPQEAITWGLGQLGFTPEDLRFEGNFDTGAAGVNDANSGSFSSEAILTKNQLFAMFGSTDPAAVAATEHMLSRLPAEERENALSDPSRWVGVQMTVPVVFSGNTYFVNGVAQSASSDRHVAPGDVWWFYVDYDCGIHITAAVRAACGNPQTQPPRPVEPKPVPTTTTTVPEDTTTTTVPEDTTTTTVPEDTTTTTVPEGKDHDKSVIDPDSDDEDVQEEIHCPTGQVVNREGKCVAPPTTTTTAAPAPVTTVPGNGGCAPGLIWNPDDQECQSENTTVITVPDSGSGGIGDGFSCPDGEIWDSATQMCVIADTSPAEDETTDDTIPPDWRP